MQGFAFKVTIMAIVLFSAAFSSSFVTSANKSTKMFNAKAGCMGCHQGETITMTTNELTDNNRDNQHYQKKNLQERSE